MHKGEHFYVMNVTSYTVVSYNLRLKTGFYAMLEEKTHGLFLVHRFISAALPQQRRWLFVLDCSHFGTASYVVGHFCSRSCFSVVIFSILYVLLLCDKTLYFDLLSTVCLRACTDAS